MVCFNSFNFIRQIYRTFMVSKSCLIWLKKISVLLFISFLLILIDSLKKFWRFVKQNLFTIVIARSLVYFIVLMLISYNHFYVTNCTNTLCYVDTSVSIESNTNSHSINIFDKSFNFSLYNSSRLTHEVRKFQKLTCWHPKVVVILTIWISSPSFSYFCILLIYWENGKMILASKLFLLVSYF